MALAQAISLTNFLAWASVYGPAPSVPTQHAAPASPAPQKAGIKAGMKRG